MIMLPMHQPLTVSDLNPVGVVAAMVGFIGFASSVWLMVWLGFNQQGKAQPAFWRWALLSIGSYALMLWGLAKA